MFCVVHFMFTDRVNFASDWGKYLQNDTARMPSFQKKIAIIFYTYFSGDVEVKKRLFEAMGWKVVLVSDTNLSIN